MTLRRLRAAGDLRLAWVLLLAAMAASATWMMLAGAGLVFVHDDIFYYMQFVAQGWDIEPAGGVEYFLAPSNGHLQILGKVLYRGLFETVGANYAVFRAFDVAGVMVCVGLFFELARRRVGPFVALVPCISLLFLGYAWESFLWAFDLHTIYALALGLAAVLVLQRDDRRGDISACVLLVLSVAMIELGLAFVAGVAIAVLLGRDPLRRAWIFLVPIVLYGCWWVWSRQFEQPAIEWQNVKLIPITLGNALAAVAGSVFGLNPTGPEVFEPTTGITAWGTAIAALAVVALVWRVARGGVPRTLWVFLAAALAYWALIALGDRAPDSSRYIFVGALLVFLVAADALAGARIPWPATLAALAVVVLAIPANVAKLYDGREPQLNDATNTRLEYAMVELARGRVAPTYKAGDDKRVADRGGHVFTSLEAGDYFAGADRFGSLAMPLDEVREQSVERLEIADATLVGAYRVGLDRASPPTDPQACPSSLDGRPDSTVYFSSPDGGALLGSRAKRPIKVAAGRFAEGSPGVELGELKPGAWAQVVLPRDAAPERWWLVVDGPVFVCPRPAG